MSFQTFLAEDRKESETAPALPIDKVQGADSWTSFLNPGKHNSSHSSEVEPAFSTCEEAIGNCRCPSHWLTGTPFRLFSCKTKRAKPPKPKEAFQSLKSGCLTRGFCGMIEAWLLLQLWSALFLEKIQEEKHLATELRAGHRAPKLNKELQNLAHSSEALLITPHFHLFIDWHWTLRGALGCLRGQTETSEVGPPFLDRTAGSWARAWEQDAKGKREHCKKRGQWRPGSSRGMWRWGEELQMDYG